MGRLFKEYLNDEKSAKYVCSSCQCDLASSSCLIWEGFMGPKQPAYLFRGTVNIETREQSQRLERLTSGLYELADVHCRACSTVLGWKYLKASSHEQRYKEGGILLQQQLLTRINPRHSHQTPKPW